MPRAPLANFPAVLQELHDTPWRLSPEAHERLRRAMLAQRLYANRYDLPLSLSGRSPFATRTTACILPYGDQGTGRPGAAGNARRKAAGRSGSGGGLSAPGAGGRRQGTLSQPGHQAGAGAERDLRDALRRACSPIGATTGSPASRARASMSGAARDRPSATATGCSRAWGTWRSSPAEIPSAPRPAAATGPGWDWRRFEGTTVPQLPLKELDKGWTSISMTIRRPKPSWAGSPIKAARAFSP